MTYGRKVIFGGTVEHIGMRSDASKAKPTSHWMKLVSSKQMMQRDY